MEENLYPMLFKRKSFHIFKEPGHISPKEQARIRESFSGCTPLVPEIRVEMKLVSGEETTCKRGQEFCILFFSERKAGYLANIGYMGEQLDLLLACMNIGVLWFGIGKTEVKSESGLDFVIMLAIAKMEESRFRKDMFKSKRKPLEEIWRGTAHRNIANIVRFAPSACNTQPWIVESQEKELRVFRYKKPGKRGIMPADRVVFYNQIDMGIFLLFLELCLTQEKLVFERTLLPDSGDGERNLVAHYSIQ